jgi:hypothetical protein
MDVGSVSYYIEAVCSLVARLNLMWPMVCVLSHISYHSTTAGNIPMHKVYELHIQWLLLSSNILPSVYSQKEGCAE